MLTSSDADLRDLAHARPFIVEAGSGRSTGLKLVSFLGCGGMSTVFTAERDTSVQSDALSTATPSRVAVKFLQPSTWRQCKRSNQDPSHLFLREVVALDRIMGRTPPTEFVVGYYGSGYADVKVGSGEVMRLPWLAIEHVDGGNEGVSLADRILRSQPQGVDPIRALRLIRGITAGVSVLHEEGIVHRDLKPENILVTGPIDDETPKVADCGIARIEGLAATVAAMTPSYGGPEQMLSMQGTRNPLIGPWTDVHALAAVIWFVLTGEDWCRSETDPAWHEGKRRGLRTANRLHAGWTSQPDAIAKLDAVLARAAAPRLPDDVWASEAASDYLWSAKKLSPAMWEGVERYASVGAFAGELMPLLEQGALHWTARAGRENRAATAFRPTQPLRITEPGTADARALSRSIPASREPTATPGNAVFQADGRYLVRFDDRLDYFIDDKPHRVNVPEEYRADVGATRWMVRGPGGGFALVGPKHITLVRGGRFTRLELPVRAGEVGEITAALHDGGGLCLVTTETDDSEGGPELWRSTDGLRWEEPLVLPIGGDVRSVAYGPYGYLVVGERRNRARALFVGFDRHPVLFTKGVTDKPPLLACVCSGGQDAWGAGDGLVLYLERGDVHEETVDVNEEAVAMGLDLVGSPWLVTTQSVLRRHVDSNSAKWRLYHHRTAGEPPFIGLGFTTSGVRVVDAGGGGVHLTPRDIAGWRPTVGTDDG